MTRRRPPSRNAVEDALMRARSHLTARDWRILELLDEHRVLTASQLCDLAFNHPTTARHRLAALYRVKVVNRFRPPPEALGGGSQPFHYVLDRYGALLLAQQRAADQDDPLEDSIYAQLGRARRQRQLTSLDPDYLLAIATSQRLRHQVAVNGFFCALVRAARHSGGQRELAEWQGEKRARRHIAAWERVCVRPDGYGVWYEDGGQLPFFFELDRGTETLDRLAGKLDGYAQAEEALQHPTWVLVSLPSEQRERHARRAMLASGRPDVPVATTHRRLPETNRRPDQAVWWPLRDPAAQQGRVRLVELAAYPFPAGSLYRAAAVRRSRAEEAARTAAREAEHQRWLAERQAREEEAARQAEFEERQAEESARASGTGRWRVFGR